MRLRTAVRVYPAIWLSPVLVTICAWYAHAFVFRTDPEPYLAGLSSQAVTTLGLIGPITAALGAWEAARLRRGGIWTFPPARSRIRVVIAPIGIIWVIGCLAVTAGVWSVILPKGFLLPDLRPLGVAALVVGAHILGGFAIGLTLPTVIVAPVAIAASLLWQVMPRAIEPLWTHLLTSQQLETCCGPDTDIGSAALVAPALVAFGIMTAAFVLILGRRSASMAVVAAVALALGIASGGVVASTQPRGDAFVARDDHVLVCDGTGPEVCVWPEHVGRLGAVADLARQAAAAWSQPGLDVPGRFDEAFPGPGNVNSLHFVVSVNSSQDLLISSMAYGMLPPFLDCEAGYEGYEAYDALNAWYASTAGMSDVGLQNQFGGLELSNGTDVLTLATEVRNSSLANQREWVTRNRWALAACDRPAQLSPIAN